MGWFFGFGDWNCIFDASIRYGLWGLAVANAGGSSGGTSASASSLTWPSSSAWPSSSSSSVVFVKWSSCRSFRWSIVLGVVISSTTLWSLVVITLDVTVVFFILLVLGLVRYGLKCVVFIVWLVVVVVVILLGGYNKARNSNDLPLPFNPMMACPVPLYEWTEFCILSRILVRISSWGIVKIMECLLRRWWLLVFVAVICLDVFLDLARGSFTVLLLLWLSIFWLCSITERFMVGYWNCASTKRTNQDGWWWWWWCIVSVSSSIRSFCTITFSSWSFSFSSSPNPRPLARCCSVCIMSRKVGSSRHALRLLGPSSFNIGPYEEDFFPDAYHRRWWWGLLWGMEEGWWFDTMRSVSVLRCCISGNMLIQRNFRWFLEKFVGHRGYLYIALPSFLYIFLGRMEHTHIKLMLLGELVPVRLVKA